MRVVLATLNAKYIHSSLALRYLAAYCHPVCSEIIVNEYTINNGLLDILSDIFRKRPNVLGLACYIWNIEMTLTLARLVKKVLPEIIIILGGPEVSYDPVAIMQQHCCVDYIVQGEGELTLAALLDALAGKGDLSCLYTIKGLVFRQSGQINVNEGPQVVPELDCIPFPYSDADMKNLNDKIIYYESSRGCPFSCQYCLSSATQGVRFYSLARVYRDLTFFIKHEVKQVKFVDRTFNARKEHYFPLLKFLSGQQCRTNFHFEIAVDLLDDEILRFLTNVPPGRFQFEIGVQSTYQPALAEICRQNNWRKIVDNVKQLQRQGNIHLHLDLIAGLPYETYWQFGQSFNNVYSLEPQMLQLGFLKLLKGSGIREHAAEHGYIYMDNAPYEVLANNYLTYGDIRKLKIIEEIFNQVYNSGRFQHVLKYLVNLYKGDAFAFYHALASYWEERELHIVAHSAKSLYRYLLDFCLAYHTEQAGLCQEFLKFDALFSEKGAVRPEFLIWNENQWSEEKNHFWRNDTIVRKYLPEFVFTTWRDVKKNYQLEVFSIDVPGFLERGQIMQRHVPILFSYRQGEGQYYIIAGEDFWQTGGNG